MTKLALLRHGPTAWTEDRRIQGRTDVPLSSNGRRIVCAWRLPEAWKGVSVLVSPLVRARETADLLGLADARVEPALAERDWGGWEGCRLADLRQRDGERMQAYDAQGLDLRPPGGETPRELQARLDPLLARLSADGRDVLAVTHRGVIRAVYALATGWDMRDDPLDRLRDGRLHVVRLAADGRPSVDALNVPLDGDAT
jgi:probable phosphoglycerate mutase